MGPSGTREDQELGTLELHADVYLTPMAKLAIDKFMEDKPEKLFHLRYDEDKPNHTKAFITKF